MDEPEATGKQLKALNERGYRELYKNRNTAPIRQGFEHHPATASAGRSAKSRMPL